MPFTLFKFPTLFGRKQSTYKLHGRAVSARPDARLAAHPASIMMISHPFNEAVLHN